MHAEHLAQPPHWNLVLKLSNEGVPYPDVLAKYTAAFKRRNSAYGRPAGAASGDNPLVPHSVRYSDFFGHSCLVKFVNRSFYEDIEEDDRIRRLRQELNLRCKQRRKFIATTNSNHNLPVAENLLEQRFAPGRPDEVWVTDITYIPTAEGWLYLAGVKDVFTCEIVGYAMGERMTQELTTQALWRTCQKFCVRGQIS